jgi:DNA-binding MarR family transcriptional regulator
LLIRNTNQIGLQYELECVKTIPVKGREHRTPAAAKEHRHDLTDALVRGAFETMAVLNKVGAENDLSLTQLRAFGVLRGRRVRMAGLAEFLGLEKSTMTGLVDRAEKRGLLERASSEIDGRVVEVFLSREGAALAERIHAQVRQALSPMISRLDPADHRRAQDLLERMLGAGEGDRRG